MLVKKSAIMLLKAAIKRKQRGRNTDAPDMHSKRFAVVNLVDTKDAR